MARVVGAGTEAFATSRSSAGSFAALCAVVVKAIPALATRSDSARARALARAVAAAVVCLARVCHYCHFGDNARRRVPSTHAFGPPNASSAAAGVPPRACVAPLPATRATRRLAARATTADPRRTSWSDIFGGNARRRVRCTRAFGLVNVLCAAAACSPRACVAPLPATRATRRLAARATTEEPGRTSSGRCGLGLGLRCCCLGI